MIDIEEMSKNYKINSVSIVVNQLKFSVNRPCDRTVPVIHNIQHKGKLAPNPQISENFPWLLYDSAPVPYVKFCMS